MSGNSGTELVAVELGGKRGLGWRGKTKSGARVVRVGLGW